MWPSSLWHCGIIRYMLGQKAPVTLLFIYFQSSVCACNLIVQGPYITETDGTDYAAENCIL